MYYKSLCCTTSVKKIQPHCNINADLKSFRPCKTGFYQMPIQSSVYGILINRDSFFVLVTVAYKTDNISVLVLKKNFQLCHKFSFSRNKLRIMPLYSNRSRSIRT
ncbi:hypothetical protein HanRHA438_Chr16g0747941 [Helianthus annuus]|nr:hypothetical protein HanRHA438_Chr16g0747941 [Helianthus annuus]